MMSGIRNRFPFTATQWQELEHQALIFKYMVSGIPIPPDLLYTIKRSCLDLDANSLSSKLFSRPQPSQHIGWNCFQMGLGRKVDPEPGRCRRTDGKKWRCSKEAYPDSKYCERHMHRGKNRSRKPVEVITATATATSTSTTPNMSSITKSSCFPSMSNLSSSSESQHHQLRYPAPAAGYQYSQVMYPHMHASSSRPQENTTYSLLDSATYSHTNTTDYRRNSFVYGLKEEVMDEHAFFSEPSGTMRSFSGSSVDDSWQLTPLTMSSSSNSNSKQRTGSVSGSGLQGDQYSYLQLHSPIQNKPVQQDYVLGSNFRGEEPQKIVHRFFDDLPPKHRDSWLDNLDDHHKTTSNTSSVSTTRLSISLPSSTSHDFPIFNSRLHTDG